MINELNQTRLLILLGHWNSPKKHYKPFCQILNNKQNSIIEVCGLFDVFGGNADLVTHKSINLHLSLFLILLKVANKKLH